MKDVLSRAEMERIGAFSIVFDKGALSNLGTAKLGALRLVLTEGALNTNRRAWAEDSLAIVRTFGLQHQHCFGVEAYDWVRLSEPQITKGWAYFLDNGRHQVTRSAAFLAALGIPEVTSSMFGAATAIAEEGRIDLKVILTSQEGTRIGAVIEAKFGHRVTSGQLPKYRRLAAGDADHMSFWIVAPELEQSSVTALNRNKAWSFVDWQRLLRRFENLLPEKADSEDFRRFRRTVWTHAYGV